MKSIESSDAAVVDVLTSDSEAADPRSDALTSSSPFRAEKHQALVELEKWAQATTDDRTEILLSFLRDTADAIRSITDNVKSLRRLTSAADSMSPPCVVRNYL